MTTEHVAIALVVASAALLIIGFLRFLKEGRAQQAAGIEAAIADVSRLAVAPGDVVLITFRQRISTEAAIAIRDAVTEKLPQGARVMILHDGAEMSVLREGCEFIPGRPQPPNGERAPAPPERRTAC